MSPVAPDAEEAVEEIDVDTPEAFDFLYDPPLGSVRYRVAYGGRGSAKSWQFARALLVHGMNPDRPLRVLCTRQYQTSIRDSVHKLLSDQIKALGLEAYYTVQDRTILGVYGTEFLFRGIAQDPAEVKSLEGVDVCWFEEAQSAADESWEILIPTIRKEGSEIWVSFNPGEPTDPTWRRFVVEQDTLSRAIVRKVNYTENPYATAVTLEEAETLRRRDPDAYAHVWEGEPWTRSELQVFHGKYRIADLGPLRRSWGTPLYGADFGYSTDPTVLVRLYVFDSILYIAAEAGGVRLSFGDIDRFWRRVPGSRSHVIRADSSRPETINEMRSRGYKVIGAPKWDGSVKDGIEWLRGTFDEIVIHPSCTMAAENFRLYRWKADTKTGDPLPTLQKGNDHVPDAIRYACSPMIKRVAPQEVWFPGMNERNDE